MAKIKRTQNGDSMLSKFEAIENWRSFDQIYEMFPQIYLDGSFQRHGGVKGGSGWTRSDGEGYLGSHLGGSTCNSIIVACVQSCLRWAKERKHKGDQRYFTKLAKKGIIYISIDGNNTSSFIYYFMGGEIAARDEDGNRLLFTDFEADDQYEIRHRLPIKVITLRRIGKKQMCKLFRDLNKSTKLNAQEHRQAHPSILSEFIRGISNRKDGVKDMRKMFQHFIYTDPLDLDKRGHEQLVAQFCLMVDEDFTTKTGKVELDNLYETVESFSPATTAKAEKLLLEACRIGLSIPTLSKKLKTIYFMNFLHFIEIADRRHLSCKMPKALMKQFLEMHSQFVVSAGKILQEEESEKSYIFWSGRYTDQGYYGKVRDLITNWFINNEQRLVDEKILTRSRTSKDYYSFEQKQELFFLQNKKTRSGLTMNIVDLYCNKYPGDHMNSFKNGGDTTISNGELMTHAENLSKGATSNEPHFPHQKEALAE